MSPYYGNEENPPRYPRNLPLFNSYTPVADGQLEMKIRRLMERIGFRVSRIQIVDTSRRSRHTNAYFTGIRHTRRIVLFDTLVRSLNHEEILAVLAHEGGTGKQGRSRVALATLYDPLTTTLLATHDSQDILE